jgi:hypothetical protein
MYLWTLPWQSLHWKWAPSISGRPDQSGQCSLLCFNNASETWHLFHFVSWRHCCLFEHKPSSSCFFLLWFCTSPRLFQSLFCMKLFSHANCSLHFCDHAVSLSNSVCVFESSLPVMVFKPAKCYWCTCLGWKLRGSNGKSWRSWNTKGARGDAHTHARILTVQKVQCWLTSHLQCTAL